ncbi:peptidyl-dipeptidase Dcp [soil metagenome]
MKLLPLFALTIAIVSLSSFDKGKKPIGLPASNPFSAPSNLHFQAPDFSRIKNEHYKPALREGIRQQMVEINKIANNPATPTFENTIVAMEKSGQLLQRVNRVFNMVSGANTNDTLQALQEEIAPQLAANQDAIYLNTKLYKRIKTIYNNRAKLHLDNEGLRLIEYYNQQFELAGARLNDADKQKMKTLNGEEAILSAKFTNELVNAAKAGALVIDNVSELAGLPQSDIDAYAQNAAARGLTGKWLIPLRNTTQQPALQSLTNRATREKLFNASVNRAQRNDSNDTRQVILRIAAIRATKANLMGFPSYAAWKLKDQMAQTPETVDRFFAQLVPSVTALAKREASDIQTMINKQNGGFTLQPWDWNFYSEQVRKEKYNLDDNEIKPYFQLDKVLENGVFYAANQLYGLIFIERHDIPVYQSDVRVFDVFDKDGKPLALFYGDYYKRDNKSGGAWMDNFVGQSKLLGTKPVIYNVCNFTKPAPGQPALISFDDVTTMFHEFGHALHGMFSNQIYPAISGTNVARDYVEFPSQINEHWALDPKVLKHYAVHYQTGQVIPQTLVDKIKNASSFNKGYALTEAIAAASLDMVWHKLTASDSVQNVNEFEKAALHKTGLDIPQVPPRYSSTYFLHIWSNGYAAGYYAYQWTKMLEEDAYSWFEENGGLTRANGQRFRDLILSKGNTVEYNKMFSSFRGRNAGIKAMQKALGLPTTD